MTDIISRLQSFVSAGDRVGYYNYLAEYGDPYGKLALGVVLHDNVAGATANRFFLNAADGAGVTVSDEQLARISHALMLADFAERVFSFETSGSIELSWNVVRTYHASVFSFTLDETIPASAWTPETVFDVIESTINPVIAEIEAQLYWDALLTSSDIVGLSWALVRTIDRSYLSDPIYLTELTSAGIQATFDNSHEFGDFELTLPSGIESSGGSPDDDRIEGKTDPNNGLGLDDILLGFDGSDWLAGGDGNDRIYGGAGENVLIAGRPVYSDDDFGITNDTGNDVLVGGDFDDILVAGGGTDILIGGKGSDTFNIAYNSPDGSPGNLSVLWGGDGEDIFYFHSTDFTIMLLHWEGVTEGSLLTEAMSSKLAEIGNDFGINYFIINPSPEDKILLVGEDISTLVNGGSPTRYGAGSYEFDLEKVSGGDFASSFLEVGDHVNKLTSSGYGGGFSIYGSLGSSGEAFHQLRDDSGTQVGKITYRILEETTQPSSFSGAEPTVQSAVAAGSELDDAIVGTEQDDDIDGLAGNDRLYGLSGDDNILGGSGDDFIIGGDGNDVLIGGSGIDYVFGSAGDDVLVDGSGSDEYDGGEGQDIAVFEGSRSNYVGSDGERAGSIVITDGTDTDTFFSVEVFRFSDVELTLGELRAAWLGDYFGTDDDDVIQLNGFQGDIHGLDGDDLISPGNLYSGSIYGGAGNDTIEVGDLTLFWDGGSGTDKLVYLGSADLNYSLEQGQIEIFLSGSGNDSLYGSAGNDRIEGGLGDDFLQGFAGDDTLVGGAGADTLLGGPGNDVLFVDDDDVYWEGGEGTDTVRYVGVADLDYNIGTFSIEKFVSGTGDDTLSGSEASEQIHGGEGNDLLSGNAGADFLLGEAGNDVLDGGADDDTLSGGEDSDLFVFSDYFGNDIIQDFEVNFDQLRFERTNFASRDEVIAATTENSDGSIRIEAANGYSVTLLGLTIDQFQSASIEVVDPSSDSGDPYQRYYDDILVEKKPSSVVNTDVNEAFFVGSERYLDENPDIESSMELPHFTVLGERSDGLIEYYSFDVQSGDLGIFDVDGAEFDTVIELFSLEGSSLAYSDDDDGDPGSMPLNSRIEYSFDQSGTYILAVSAYADNFELGDRYLINYSIGNASVTTSFGTEMSTLASETAEDSHIGSRGADTFIFDVDFGRDRITDFDENDDVIVFDRDVFADFADLLNSSSERGRDVIIAFDNDNQLRLERFEFADLDQDQFRFV